jgi:hypothetical protein
MRARVRATRMHWRARLGKPLADITIVLDCVSVGTCVCKSIEGAWIKL